MQTYVLDMRVFQGRAWLLVAEGNHDEAMQMAIDMFRLSRHSERNPGLAGYLAAIDSLRSPAIDAANLVLEVGPISKATREALDAELAVQEQMNRYTRAIKCAEHSTWLCVRKVSGPVSALLADRPVGVWNQRESE